MSTMMMNSLARISKMNESLVPKEMQVGRANVGTPAARIRYSLVWFRTHMHSTRPHTRNRPVLPPRPLRTQAQRYTHTQQAHTRAHTHAHTQARAHTREHVRKHTSKHTRAHTRSHTL
jgi:hypothetical protein